MEYTKEQQQAIDISGNNLLVSAAAGSGKTAVLVKRIENRITDASNPVDIDRMLVMTFTKAAADQMKSKIIKAIEEKKEKDPFNEHLQKQAALVHNAQITTIHGFCTDILRNHFSTIGLEPDFRIGDTGEMKLLEQDTLKELLEEEYTDPSDDFLNMTESVAAGKNDKSLEDIVLKLYNYAMSYPDPEGWLDGCSDPYTKSAEGKFDDTVHAKILFEYVVKTLIEVRAEYNRILDVCNRPDGPNIYIPTIKSDLEMLNEMLDAESYSAMWALFYPDHKKFVNLGTGSKTITDKHEINDSLKKQVKNRRDKCKETINDIKQKYFGISYDMAIKNIGASASTVEEIVRITKRFIEKFSEIKRENNICDFNDLEHLALKILGLDEPTSVSLEYKKFYKEIFIDEYQDSNAVQELLLDRVSNGKNLFMVGDVKQSIYKFRLAKPDIFMGKYNRYINVDDAEQDKITDGIKIDLNSNFRSRGSVLESVNEVFKTIMTYENGAINYDDAASLKTGATDYPIITDEGFNDTTELMLIGKDDDIPNIELEAKAVANKIVEVMKSHHIYDRDKKEFRDVRYSDIAILLRANKGWDDVFKKVISETGIPVHVESQSGYFEAYEVSVLMDLLRVIDNPRQDIPLMAVLLSPFGNMTDKMIAECKIEADRIDLENRKASGNVKDAEGSRKRCLYDVICMNADINPVVAEFLKQLNTIRSKVGYTPVYEILRDFIDGKYGNYIASLPDGARRTANLNMLLKKAQDYGKISYKGLFHFVRYIDAIKKYEVDFGEANILDENDNTVRIMSIHKSKGLEFPVCFVAGLNKQYNYMDARSAIVLDMDMGIGVDYVDLDKRTRTSTLIKNVIAEKIMRETYEEEMRMLYVAMTRAKEKLIMSAVVDNPENNTNVVMLSKCKRYLELINYAESVTGLNKTETTIVNALDLVDAEVKEAVLKEEIYDELINKITNPEESESEFIRNVKKHMSFNYVSPPPTVDNYKKISVSELKRLSHETALSEDKDVLSDNTAESSDEIKLYSFGNDEPVIPKFMSEDEPAIKPTMHGTAVHRVFELWEYGREITEESIKNFLDEILLSGKVETELVKSITVREIKGFLESDVASRMKKADENGFLHREQPFVIEMDEHLIQGIVDAYFIEDNEIVVVDYKTDRVKTGQELAERYHAQLEYYGRALSRLLGKKVKELIIYSTRLKSEIRLEMPANGL